MTADLKPYPSYKPSGVAWLGEVPAHWEVRRVKHAFRRIVGGSTPSSSEAAYWDGTIIWVTPTDISKVTRLRDSLRRITKKGFNSCSATLVPVGSLVVTSRAPVGNVALAEVPLCTNQGCKTLVPESQVIDSTYGYQVFGILQDELQSLANGTTFTEISTNALGNVLLPIPPLAEQAAIVAYLDHTDGRIRRYLRSRERLIELLKEYRQAVVHEVVTRGLDPDVPLKPSGVEWLGEVPTHWEVRRLKYLLSECATRSVDGSEQLLSVSQYTGVTQRKQAEGKDEVDTRAESLVGYKCVEFNDLVVNIMLAWNGSMGVSRFCGIVSPSYCVYRFKTDVYPWYFHYLLRSPTYRARIRAISTGIVESRLRMYTDDLYHLEVPLPPLAEQAAIVAYLDKETAAIDAAMARARREVELLSEYRTRLIADVVTGQVDVCEAARLSDGCETLNRVQA